MKFIERVCDYLNDLWWSFSHWTYEFIVFIFAILYIARYIIAIFFMAWGLSYLSKEQDKVVKTKNREWSFTCYNSSGAITISSTGTNLKKSEIGNLLITESQSGNDIVLNSNCVVTEIK